MAGKAGFTCSETLAELNDFCINFRRKYFVGNPISEELTKGTFGELIVQIRLLQYGVQAAPPLKDSGNDLIAIKQSVIKTIQVKTTSSHNVPRWPPVDKLFHILAIVRLSGEGLNIFVDATDVYLVPKEMLLETKRDWASLSKFILSEQYIEKLFNS